MWLALSVLLLGAVFIWINRDEAVVLRLNLAARERETAIDLDKDGRMEYCSLQRLYFVLRTETEMIWESPEEWKVEDYLYGDLTGNGEIELLLLVWKRGSFGSSRPFWLEADETTYSQHLYIYRLQQGDLRPVWMSSALQPQIVEWEWGEDPVWGNILWLTHPGGELGDWRWGEWGLERI